MFCKYFSLSENTNNSKIPSLEHFLGHGRKLILILLLLGFCPIQFICCLSFDFLVGIVRGQLDQLFKRCRSFGILCMLDESLAEQKVRFD